MYWGIELAKYLPFSTVESLVVLLSKLWYGGLEKYGIQRPDEGPFTLRKKYGKFPLVDAGTYNKIKSGEIQVRSRLQIAAVITHCFGCHVSNVLPSNIRMFVHDFVLFHVLASNCSRYTLL